MAVGVCGPVGAALAPWSAIRAIHLYFIRVSTYGKTSCQPSVQCLIVVDVEAMIDHVPLVVATIVLDVVQLYLGLIQTSPVDYLDSFLAVVTVKMS